MSGNSKKARFLASIVQASVDLPDDTLARRCKFNFSYFCKQEASQDFAEWPPEQLAKLLQKLKDYSKESLDYWKQQSIGKSGRVLAIYDSFPAKTDLIYPSHVPHQARWARFRLESAVRLIGFVLPDSYHGKPHDCGERFDCNTFYIVFLDAEHAFYKTEAK